MAFHNEMVKLAKLVALEIFPFIMVIRIDLFFEVFRLGRNSLYIFYHI